MVNRPRPESSSHGSGSSEQGSVILALLVSIIAAGLMTVIVATVIAGQRSVRFDEDFTQAVHVAEHSVAEVLFDLNNGLLQPTDLDASNQKAGSGLLSDGTRYDYTVEWDGERGWTVTSTGGVEDGVQRTVEVLIEERPLFHLAAFSDRHRMVAWDMRGHGETDSPVDPAQYSAALTVADMRALLLGRTLLGERVFDVDRAIDYLESRGDVDMTTLGLMGNSGGGLAVFAIDPETGKLRPTGQQLEIDAAVHAQQRFADAGEPVCLPRRDRHDVRRIQVHLVRVQWRAAKRQLLEEAAAAQHERGNDHGKTAHEILLADRVPERPCSGV